MNELINVENLSFGYSKQLLLQNISFTVPQGKICTILGSNGVGKSTLLKCLCGILHPNTGKIYIDGFPISHYTYQTLAQKISVVRQENQYVFPYTALEIVLMGRNPHIHFLSQPSEEDTTQAYNSLDWVGLGHFAHRKMNELSSGERQMVLLARAICQQPKILLLDEPNSHLDIANQWNLLQKIREHCLKTQCCVIAVLHLPELAYWLSDTIILLQKGQILAYGTPQEIMTEPNLSNVYHFNITIQQLQTKYMAIYPKHLQSSNK